MDSVNLNVGDMVVIMSSANCCKGSPCVGKTGTVRSITNYPFGNVMTCANVKWGTLPSENCNFSVKRLRLPVPDGWVE